MWVGKRAICYLKRKKSKTAILILVLLVTESMILCTATILRATKETVNMLKEKTESKIVAEIVNESERITEADFLRIKDIEQIKIVNREAKTWAYPSGFQVISESQNTDVENQLLQLETYDNLELDGNFSEGQIRLIEGTLPQKSYEIVINQFLASLNQYEIGDELTIRTKAGKTAHAMISGFFLSGMERKQPKEMSAVYRIENMIYGKIELISQIQDVPGYERVFIYLNDPEAMKEVGQSILKVLGDKVDLTKSDMLFQQMRQPLEQVIGIVLLMLYLTMGTAMIVVTLLLCMWTRSRKKEVAVYFSLGEHKLFIFMQMILESILVFIPSTLAATVIGKFLAQGLKSILFNDVSSARTLQISIQFIDIGFVIAIGSGILLFAVFVSLLPMLKENPNNILSEMEG